MILSLFKIKSNNGDYKASDGYCPKYPRSESSFFMDLHRKADSCKDSPDEPRKSVWLGFSFKNVTEIGVISDKSDRYAENTENVFNFRRHLFIVRNYSSISSKIPSQAFFSSLGIISNPISATPLPRFTGLSRSKTLLLRIFIMSD